MTKAKLRDSEVNQEKSDEIHEEKSSVNQVESEVKNKHPKQQLLIKVTPSTYMILEQIQKKHGKPTLNDAIMDIYHLYPWHVLTCEDCQKQALEKGIIIATKEQLSDTVNRERAVYYVKGVNRQVLSDLPEEVRQYINVK